MFNISTQTQPSSRINPVDGSFVSDVAVNNVDGRQPEMEYRSR